MDNLLISTLETELKYPVYLQGSLANKDYPTNFFTYWNDSADGSSFYSNEEKAVLWQYSLNFYSSDPLLVDATLLEAKKVLKSVGFIVSGFGYSVMSDKPTHTGRGITILYRQEI